MTLKTPVFLFHMLFRDILLKKILLCKKLEGLVFIQGIFWPYAYFNTMHI